MKRKTLYSTSMILMLSVFTKLLSFFTRIFLVRTLSTSTMNTYALASPTLVFVISIAQFGIGNALSRQVAKSKSPYTELKVATLFAFVHTIFITSLFLLAHKRLCELIYHTSQYQACFIIIAIYIPFVCYCSILRGYLYGLQHHIQAGISACIEELARFLYLLFCFQKNIAILPILENIFFSFIIGECISIVYMMICIMKHKNRYHCSALTKQSFFDLISLSYTMTFARCFASLAYFLEPIVMNLFLKQPLKEQMLECYGIIQGMILPLVSMPSFITLTLSNVLLPYFTYHYHRGRYQQANHYFFLILVFCLSVGISFSTICSIIPSQILHLLYHTTIGSNLLKQISWPYAIYMLQAPLTSVMYSLNLGKKALQDTCIASLLRLLSIPLCSAFLHEQAIPLSILLNIAYTTFAHAYHIYHYFKSNEI